MPQRHSDLIEVRKVHRKGRGVFARDSIAKGTVIERAPVILIPISEVFGEGRHVRLADYVFAWGKDTVAIALGYGSLYNHSFRPNARYFEGGGLTQIFMAIRDIQRGEEITINYNGEPGSRIAMGFPVVDGDQPT